MQYRCGETFPLHPERRVSVWLKSLNENTLIDDDDNKKSSTQIKQRQAPTAISRLYYQTGTCIKDRYGIL